jgi:hypothetical protein
MKQEGVMRWVVVVPLAVKRTQHEEMRPQHTTSVLPFSLRYASSSVFKKPSKLFCAHTSHTPHVT